MAGFRGGGAGPVDVRVVPHPAVTLVLEFGNDPLVVDAATGRQQRVAADSGYVDQSHLHRDVLAFTAMTPATVVGQPWLAVEGTAWTGTATRTDTSPRAARPAASRDSAIAQFKAATRAIENDLCSIE